MLRSAHPAAELVEISQAESVSPVNDDRVGVGNIEAALNDGCAYQNIDITGNESRHHSFELVRVHLSMADVYPGVRQEIRDSVPDALDGLHAVVQKEHLTLPFHLAMDRLADNPLIITADDCLHRQSVQRRCFD